MPPISKAKCDRLVQASKGSYSIPHPELAYCRFSTLLNALRSDLLTCCTHGCLHSNSTLGYAISFVRSSSRCAACWSTVAVGLVLGRESEAGRYRAEQHLLRASTQTVTLAQLNPHTGASALQKGRFALILIWCTLPRLNADLQRHPNCCCATLTGLAASPRGRGTPLSQPERLVCWPSGWLAC